MDHKTLLPIYGLKKGIPVHSGSRFQRWTISLSGYNLDIHFCHTTVFDQADVLSRFVCNHQKPGVDTVIAAASIEADVRLRISDAIRGIPVTIADIQRDTY
ncbi:hypothetical protein SprV_0401567300 [Sparganum proliferum]